MGPFATHRFLTRLALSAAHVFAWLFVFQYFFIITASLTESVAGTALAYALTHVVSVLLTPYTARRLRHGVRGVLVNALLALAVAYAILAAAFAGLLGSLGLGLGVGLFAVCMGAYRALYWIPYELASRKSHDSTYMEILFVCVPAAVGIYLSSAPQAPLIALAVASGLALLAIVPLMRVKNTQEGFSWNYRETFHKLFEPAHRIPLIQAMLNGFEGAALLLLWPIVIFVLLNWSYSLLGAVLSATLAGVLFVRMLLGDHHAKLQTPVIHAAITISGWVLRGTIAAPFAIVLVDSYYQSGSGSSSRGVNLVTAEQSADSNTYLDEMTALKDMGQGIGRIIFCLLLAFLAAIASFSMLSIALFGVAGLAAVLSILLSRRKPVPLY